MARVIPKPQLDEWQRSVLADYASGEELKDIAKKNYVSYKVVLRTTQKIKKILGANHLSQAILMAYAWGYLTLPNNEGKCYPTIPWEEAEF